MNVPPISNFQPPLKPPKKTKDSSVPVAITHAGIIIGQAAAKQFKKDIKISLLDRVLGVPPEIQALILKNVSLNDLKAFHIALAKGRRIDEKVLNQLHKQIDKAILLKEIDEILIEHPSWKNAVEAWGKGISPENKRWLLGLYELHEIGVKIPMLVEGIPSQESLALLKQKDQIEKALKAVKEVCLGPYSLFKEPFKFPDALSMLPNLEKLDIQRLPLKNTPNISMNTQLKFLNLFDTHLCIPPDVSHNILLETLNLSQNALKEAPNLHNNPHLKTLNLDLNQIEKAPDVSRNKKLINLYISDNQLSQPPDVSHNKLLVQLDLSTNKLKQCPNLEKNKHLEHLHLQRNEIHTSPDLTNNPALKTFYIHKNQLTKFPILPKNNVIDLFDISHNRLLASEKPKFEKWQKDKSQSTE